MIKNYLKIALRSFLKRKVYSFINIVGLSVGIVGCLLVFLFVEDEISFDKFNKNYGDIYRINTSGIVRGAYWPGSSSSPIMGEAFSEQIPGITSFARIRPSYSGLLIKQGGAMHEQFLIYTDPDLFKIFTFPFVKGEPEKMFQDPNSIVLSESLAATYFGDELAIGKQLEIELNGSFQTLTVTGVFKDIPYNSSLRFDMALPFSKYSQITPERRFTSWFDLHITTFVMLDPETDIAGVEVNMEKILHTHVPDEDDFKSMIGLQSLSDIHLNNEIDRSNGMRNPADPMLSKILIVVGIFILVIACINFTNLSIGMSLPRSREIGLRKVIGARRRQLGLQFLGEAFITSLAAFLLALLWADLLIPSFNELTGKYINLWDANLTLFLIVSILLIVITTLLAGGYPALILSGSHPVDAVKGKLKLASKSWFSKALVIIQFSLSVFLIIGTLTISKQLDYLVTRDLGYNDQGLISIVAYRENGNRLLEQFRTELAGNPMIREVTGFGGNYDQTEVKYGNQAKLSVHVRVDPDYLKALEIPIVSGRGFSYDQLQDSTTSILVNQAFLREYNIEDPIGKNIGYTYYDNMPEARIIGVMQDFHYRSLKREIQPLIFHINPQRDIGEIWVKVDTDKMPDAIALLEKTWRKFVDYRPFEYSVIAADNQAQYRKEQELSKLIGYASILAVFISCLGLFGLASIHIQQRSKEISIRKVLGASVSRVVVILSKNFTALILISVLVASPIAYFISKQWLNQFPFKATLGPGLFISATVIMMSVAWITISYQAIKTAVSNPVDNLKNE